MATPQQYPGHLPGGVFARAHTDRAAIPQSVLDISRKTRSNPLEWKGQFSPQFVEAIVEHYKSRASRVLDPFAGSGTVLLESARAGISAVGLEVNPAAANLAGVYSLARLTSKQRTTLVRRFLRVTSGLGDDGPLFSAKHEECDPADVLIHAWRESSNGGFVEGLPELLSALVTLADFYKRPLDLKKVTSLRSRLVDLVKGLPADPPGGVVVRLADARRSHLSDREIDLIVTSPPYINVYNYHQKYRASVEEMGWKVLCAARSEIGSNRKHRQNRILTVVQYALDMAQVLTEAHRVLRPGGTAVFVVGKESMVRKTAFYNGELLAEIAVEACGFDLVLKQERVFSNKFGQSIFEDVLHLAPNSTVKSDIVRDSLVREIARRVLEDARSRCPVESISDIESALSATDTIEHSPILEPENLRDVNWLS